MSWGTNNVDMYVVAMTMFFMVFVTMVVVAMVIHIMNSCACKATICIQNFFHILTIVLFYKSHHNKSSSVTMAAKLMLFNLVKFLVIYRNFINCKKSNVNIFSYKI